MLGRTKNACVGRMPRVRISPPGCKQVYKHRTDFLLSSVLYKTRYFCICTFTSCK